MKKDSFLLPFLNSILDYVARNQMYSFMDGYMGYNQVKMAKINKEQIVFISEWEAYAYNIMLFGLCNVLATFQKVITNAFKNYFE